ncbi:MAG TPA: bifunctional glycosyltransferase/class I SAM-dependent methyltransferase [Candidatus Binataceae bacterium]|nr:bifunctional glycosyltransferase/class I SAM-dependent methyltransferase [Candidatus Binataceae bacterium]
METRHVSASPKSQFNQDESVSLTVLTPVYNERRLVAESLARLIPIASERIINRMQIVVVDDGSNDGTANVLADFEREHPSVPGGKIEWVFLRHEQNRGKGAAIRTALARANGDIVLIHDADLEYDPKDIPRMLRAFFDRKADAVFGSRFANAEVRRVLFFWHQLANKFLTALCNLLVNLNFTDVNTCYKAISTPLLKSIPLVSNDFRIEPEIALKLARRRARIFEVPISYNGRTYREGKKVAFTDAILALAGVIQFAVTSDLYPVDRLGAAALENLSQAPRFNAWMADAIQPYCGNRLLEIGAGIGNLTAHLLPRGEYVASDVNQFYIDLLDRLAADHPNMKAAYCDVHDASSFPPQPGGYDTVICINVLEHAEDDARALSNIRQSLAPSGKALVLVPNGPWNFGSLDAAVGHQRRYTPETLRQLAERCGFEIERMIPFNRIGTIAWFINGRILQRKTFGIAQAWLLNLLTPIMRILDPVVPLPPLSLIAVLRPQKAEIGAAHLSVEKK